MNIHEYQSKQILREFGVNVPNGLPAFSVQEAPMPKNSILLLSLSRRRSMRAGAAKPAA